MVVKRCNLYLGVVGGGCVDYDGPGCDSRFFLLCTTNFVSSSQGFHTRTHAYTGTRAEREREAIIRIPSSSSCPTLSCAAAAAEVHGNLSNRPEKIKRRDADANGLLLSFLASFRSHIHDPYHPWLEI
jgi:hypothetical protein